MDQSLNQIASFYAKFFYLDFTQPIQFPPTNDRSRDFPRSFKHMFHDLFNLFSHSFDPELPTPLDPIQNSTTTSTTISITTTSTTAAAVAATTYSSTTPNLTFPSKIPDISESPTLSSSSFHNLTSFPKEFTRDSPPITPVRTNHQTTGPIITPFNCGCTQAKSHIFTHHSFNSEQYIQRFLDVIGDPTAFASHLRHTVLLCHFLFFTKSLPIPDVCRLTNQLILLCLVHFHIICEYYNIVQCGSLDFAMLVNHVAHISNNPFLKPPRILQYNDDEIHFLTRILPNAFQSSPMYPGALNKGIIFPSSLDPAQSAAFTQHYTQLLQLSSSDDSKSSSSSSLLSSSSSAAAAVTTAATTTTTAATTASSPTITSTKNSKVPTANIPFSVFVYLALLNHMLYLRVELNQCWWSYHTLLLSVFSHIPNIPSNLECHLIRRLSVPKPLLLIELNDKLQSLNIKLHQHVRFPILQHDPWASLKSHNSIVINEIVPSITQILLDSRTKKLHSQFSFTASLFGLQLAHITIVLLWSTHISPFTTKHPPLNQQTPVVPNNVNSGDQSSAVSAFRLQYQQSYHPSGDAPTSVVQSTKLSTPNQIASTLPIHIPKPIYMYFLSEYLLEYFSIEPTLFLVITILETAFINKFNILSHFHPSFLFMILSLMITHYPRDPIGYDYHCVRFLRILNKCLTYNLDPHLDSTIRSILNLYFEYACMYRDSKAEMLPSPHTLSSNAIFQTNILPGFNHILASIYYVNSSYSYRKDYCDHDYEEIVMLQSELSTLFSDVDYSAISHWSYVTIVEQMISCNNSDHAVYRKQSPNFPLTYPSVMADPEGRFCDLSAKAIMYKLLCSFSYFFRRISVSLLSNNLHYINLTQDVLNSTNIAPLQAYQYPVNQHNDNYQSSISHSPSFQSSTTLNDQAQHSDITMHSFSHPATLLGMDPELYCIPYMAIQHNFSRTLFHLISSHDWNNSAEFKVQEKGFFPCLSFMPFLLYLNLLHTFLCKPITIIQMEKELNSNPSAFGEKSTPITLFQKLTSLSNNTNNNNNNNNNTFNADDTNSKLDALKSWNCCIPTSSSPSTSITPLSLSNQLPLHNILTNADTVFDPSIITYSSLSTDTQTPASPFTFDKFCQTPHCKANLYKHAHLPPSVIKQLYYIYTEALIFTIQGYSFASFASKLNDPTTLTLNVTESEPSFATLLLNDPTKPDKLKPPPIRDIGISTLSFPLYWKDKYGRYDDYNNYNDGGVYDDYNDYDYGNVIHEGEVNNDEDDYHGVPLRKMINLKTKLQCNQLTDFGGTIQQATEVFRFDEDGKSFPLCAAMVQNDSYHQHIMSLCNNPQQVSYSFKPHRDNNKSTILRRGATRTVPDCALDQRRTGTIAIAYEWSSAMVQHSIELFIELLLNQGSWEFVSQIDFSDDKQPLAEEYVIDYIPRDRADWGDKDKWTSNIPPNCTDKDTTFPLYKQFVPTKYRAQIPTLATAAMCPKHPELLPHSIYHPDNTTQEQKDALATHYHEIPSLVPAFVFQNDFRAECDKFPNLGFKTPTRGHLPYFYNLSTEEQDELYQTFSFTNLTSASSFQNPFPVLSSPSSLVLSSPLSTTTLTSTTNKEPLSLDIDLAEYFNQMNNALPHHFEQEMLRSLKKALPPSSNNEVLLQHLQERLCSQSQFMIGHYSSALSGSNTSTFTSQDIAGIFTAPSINDEYITPNTQHLYSSLPPSITTPQLLPATFTVPTSLLLAQIQLKERSQLFE